MGLVSQVFDETRAELAAGPHRGRALPLLHHRRQHLGERPADARRRPPPARSPSAHNGNLTNTAELRDLVARSGYGAGRRGELRRGNTTDTALVTALLAGDPDRTLEATALEVLPAAARRVLLRLHGRAHAVRRPRPAGHPPAGARPPRARLGGGQRDRGPRHRRRQPSSARSSPASSSRSTPTACARTRFAAGRRPRAASSSTSTWPARTPRSPAAVVHEARVEMGRRLAREHPVEADLVIPTPGVRHAGRDRLRRRSPASPTARAWSRTPTSAAPSSSPARPSASSASGSSSTRCARSSAASGWSSSTTRSCAATPSAPWSGCCARPARPRCTCGSPRPPVKLALLLRHRLRHPGRADRHRPGRRGGPRQHRRRLASATSARTA